MARLWYIRKRIVDLDPILFARKDSLVELLSVLSINLGIGLSFMGYSLYYGSGYPYIYYNPFSPTAVILGYFFGLFLILRLSGISHGVWFERMKIDETTDEITSSSLEEVKHGVVETYDAIENESIEAEDKPVSHGRSVSYLEVILRTQGLNLIWLLSSLSITAVMLYAESSFLVMGTIVILFTQLPGAIGLHLGNAARAKNKHAFPLYQDERRWSFLRRYLTFPEEVFPVQSTLVLRIDLILSFVFIVFGVILALTEVTSFGFNLLFLFFTCFMALRFVTLNHRWSNPVSRRYSPLEFVSTFFSIIFGNFFFYILTAVGLPSSWGGYNLQFQYLQYFTTVWILFSIYLMYSMVSRGGKIWYSSTSTPKTK